MTLSVFHYGPVVWPESSQVKIPREIEEKYGKGISFPTEIQDNATWSKALGIDHIWQSMFVILTTPIGSRIMRPDFGSMLPFLVFENASNTVAVQAKQYTGDALSKWEPRINVLKTIVGYQEDNLMHISVVYNIKGLADKYQFDLPINGPEEHKFLPPNNFSVGKAPVFDEIPTKI